MSNKTRALIFGHSHAWSLRRAIESREFATVDPDIEIKVILYGTQKFPGPLVCRSPNNVELINPALISALSDFPAKTEASNDEIILISAVQGNFYNIVGMLDEGDPFDFIFPGREDIPLIKSGKIIPYDAIVKAITAQASELPPFFKRLSTLGYSRIVHLGVPPPHPDGGQIQSQLVADPKFTNKLVSVSPRSTRLKLWLVQELVINSMCRASGVSYLSAPISATDGDGYLKSHLCKDAIHGTSEYACMVLTDLESKIKIMQMENE